jgi:plastocyanin
MYSLWSILNSMSACTKLLINKKQVKIIIILLTSTAISIAIAIANVALAQSSSGSTPSSSVRVQAGGGNSTLPYTIFNPQSVQVKQGQSVMWYNPSKVGEPHTVTFALDNKTKPDLSATFAVRNSSSFMPVPSNSTSEPVIIPNRQNQSSMSTILGSNAIASNPVVIASAGNVKHLSHNAAYSVQGNEKLVNSGLLFPKGMGPPNGSTSFTLTFERVGIYNYYCILHPWQKGKVVVQ